MSPSSLILRAMDLAAARGRIENSIAQMNRAYGRPLFDEWAILSLSGRRCLSAYGGPRPEDFRRALPDDVGPLFVASKGKELHEVTWNSPSMPKAQPTMC